MDGIIGLLIGVLVGGTFGVFATALIVTARQGDVQDEFWDWRYADAGSIFIDCKNGYYLEAALYDTEENLIYVNSGRYENVGLHPGSEVTVAMYVDNDTLTYFESNGIQIGSADGLVYYVQ